MKPEAALRRHGRHLKKRYDIMIPLQVVLVGWNLIRRWRIKCYGDDDNKVKIETEKNKEWKRKKDENWSLISSHCYSYLSVAGGGWGGPCRCLGLLPPRHRLESVE